MINTNKKSILSSFEDILKKKLKEGSKPTRAVESALEEYNNSQGKNKGISIATAWRKYKKLKNFKK